MLTLQIGRLWGFPRLVEMLPYMGYSRTIGSDPYSQPKLMVVVADDWQIYCCFLFLAGACLFGTLVSQINDIFMTVRCG